MVRIEAQEEKSSLHTVGNLDVRNKLVIPIGLLLHLRLGMFSSTSVLVD